MQQDFAVNLSLLCGYYRSVSEVCRRLGVNRTQFNRYLHGDTQPSRQVMRKICDFFGVEQHEIFLPPHQFSQIIQVRPVRSRQSNVLPYSSHIQQLQRLSAGEIAKYAGYYFEYYYSMSYPTAILRALVQLNWDGEGAYYTRVERLSRVNSSERSFKCRYYGMAFFLGGRLFLSDYESLTQNEISQTVLFPTYKSRTTYLTGLKLGAAAESRRLPTCTRVVYEVLGRDIDIRAALRLCGLFDQDSDSIAADVKVLIDNRMQPGDRHFVGISL